MNLENWGHFRPVAEEALHIQLPATFLYHLQLHQGNPQILATPAYAASLRFQSRSLRTGSLLSGMPHLHHPQNPPPLPIRPLLPGGLFPLAPDKGPPSLLWVLRNFPALEGRACLASSPRNQLLDQLDWQNCNYSFGVLPISANGLSLAQAKTWEPSSTLFPSHLAFHLSANPAALPSHVLNPVSSYPPLASQFQRLQVPQAGFPTCPLQSSLGS